MKVNFKKFINFALIFVAINFNGYVAAMEQPKRDLSNADYALVNWNLLDWSKVDLAKLIGPDSKWVDQAPAPQPNYSQGYAQYAAQHLTEGESYLFHEPYPQAPLTYFPDWFMQEHISGDQNSESTWMHDEGWYNLINKYRIEKKISRYENIRRMHGIDDKDLLNNLIPQEWQYRFMQFRQDCIERDKLIPNKLSYAARFIIYDMEYRPCCATYILAQMASHNDPNALMALGFSGMDLNPKLQDINPKAIKHDSGPSSVIPTIAVQAKPIGIEASTQTKSVESNPIVTQTEPIEFKPTTIQNAIAEEKIVPAPNQTELKIQEVRKTEMQTPIEPVETVAIQEPAALKKTAIPKKSKLFIQRPTQPPTAIQAPAQSEPANTPIIPTIIEPQATTVRQEKTDTKIETTAPAVTFEVQQEKQVKPQKSKESTSKPTFLIQEPTESDLKTVDTKPVDTSIDTQPKTAPKLKPVPKKKTEKTDTTSKEISKKEVVKPEPKPITQEPVKQEKSPEKQKQSTKTLGDSPRIATKDKPCAATTTKAPKNTDKNIELWELGKKALAETNLEKAVNLFEPIFSLSSAQKQHYTKAMLTDFSQTIAQIHTHIDQRPVYALLIRIGLIMGFESVGLNKEETLKDFIGNAKDEKDPSVLFMLGYLFIRESELLDKLLTTGHGVHQELSLITLNKCLEQNEDQITLNKAHIFDEAFQEIIPLAKSMMQKHIDYISECFDLEIPENIQNIEQIKACYNICKLLLQKHKITESMEWYTCAEYSLKSLLDDKTLSKETSAFWQKFTTNIDSMIRAELKIKDELNPKKKTALLAGLATSASLRISSGLSGIEHAQKSFDAFIKDTKISVGYMNNKIAAHAFFQYALYIKLYTTPDTSILYPEVKDFILNLEGKALEICPNAKMFMVQCGMDIIELKVQNSQDEKDAIRQAQKAIELLNAANKSKNTLLFLAKIYDPALDTEFELLKTHNGNRAIKVNEEKTLKYLKKALAFDSDQAAFRLIRFYVSQTTHILKGNATEFERCIQLANNLLSEDQKLIYRVMFHYKNNNYAIIVNELAESIKSLALSTDTQLNSVDIQGCIILSATSALRLKNVKLLEEFVNIYMQLRYSYGYNRETERNFIDLLELIKFEGMYEKDVQLALALLRIGQDNLAKIKK